MTAKAIWAGIGVYTVFLIFIGRMTVQVDHEEECASEIKSANALLTRISILEQDMLESRLDEALSCREVEKGICTDKIMALKKNYKSLRCKICKQTED